MDNITLIPAMLRGSVKIYATESKSIYTVLCAALRLDKCTVENILFTEAVKDVLEKLKMWGYKYTYNSKKAMLTLAPKKNFNKAKCETGVKLLLKEIFTETNPELYFGDNNNFRAEGDFKKASLFLVADALGCDVECKGVSLKSNEKYAVVLDIIRKAGGKILETEDGIKVRRTACMKGISVNAEDICDLVPIIAVLLCFCEGESRITGAGLMRMGQSDRLSALVRELSHLGADIRETSDGMIIHGVGAFMGDTAYVNGDGELALALSVAACRCESQYFYVCGGKTAAENLFENFCEIYKSLEW